MSISGKLAAWLATTRFGRRARDEGADLSIFKARPSPRTLLGLFLIGSSYLLGLPGMAFIGSLAYTRSEPLILLIAGGALMITVHVMFAFGVYLAGANYAKVLIMWATGKFLRKHLSPP